MGQWCVVGCDLALGIAVAEAEEVEDKIHVVLFKLLQRSFHFQVRTIALRTGDESLIGTSSFSKFTIPA